jgi:hypothetical protein
MANFTPSNLVAGQALFAENYRSAEWRLPDTAILASMFTGAKANPGLATLREREDRTVSAYLPIKRAAGSATARAYNHTGTRGDSKAVSLTWNTIAETFSISIKQNDNNVIPFDLNYASQLRGAIDNVLERHEAALLALLIADRTQINKGRIQGAWNAIDNVMEVNKTSESKFFQNVRASMKNNLYRNNIMVVADSLAWMNAEFGSAQGQANATNLGFQFNGLNLVQTTADIDTDYEGAALAWSMDAAGIVPWIPKQNRKALNANDAMSFVGDFGSISVPVLDDKGNTAYTLDFALHAYAQRADSSASNGSAQDVELEVEVSLDIAYVAAPLSAIRATGTFTGKTDSVIYQFGQLAV